MARSKTKRSATTQGAMNRGTRLAAAGGKAGKTYLRVATAAAKSGKSGMAAHKAGLRAAGLS